MLKRSMFAILTVLFLSPVFAGAIASGETGTGRGDDVKPTNTSTTPTSEKKTEDVPETVAQKAEREVRLKRQKEEQKIKLGATEKAHIMDKCQAAQGKTSNITGRFKGIETSRDEVHKNLVSRLTALSEKLKAKGIDTTQLDTDIATLSTKIETFNTDLATYKQSVADLKALDCKTNQDAFKADLQTSRTTLEKVRAGDQAVQTYLKEPNNPILKTLSDKEVTETKKKENKTGGTQ